MAEGDALIRRRWSQPLRARVWIGVLVPLVAFCMAVRIGSRESGMGDPEFPAEMLFVLLIFYAVEIPFLLLERLPRFRLRLLLLIVAVISVLLAVAKERPALGFWLAVVTLPAFLWTCAVMSWCIRVRRPVRASKTVLIFLGASGYTILAIYGAGLIVVSFFPYMIR